MSEKDPQRQNKVIVSSPYAWLVLGVLTLIYISSFVDRQIIAVLAVQIQQELDLTNLEIGTLYGPSFSIIYAFCGILMGRLADLYSRKWMIIIGLTVWSLMTAASGLATSLAFLITARMAVGVSQSALSPSVYSLLADYFRPEQRATVYSIYASGIFLGIGTAFLIGGTIAQLYNWRAALMAVGLPGVVLAVIAGFIIKELPRGLYRSETTGSDRSMSFMGVLRYVLEKKTVLLHLAGFSFLAFTGYTVLGFIGTVLTRVYDAAGMIPYYGWFMLATGGSVILSGKIADRLAGRFDASKRFVMGIVAGLVCLPFYWFGLFAESALAALLLIGLANVISSSYNGVAAALLQYLVKPEMRALAGGIYLFVISVVGFGIGPPLTGWLMDTVFTDPYGPSRALMLVITCCGVLGSTCFIFAMRTYRNDAV